MFERALREFVWPTQVPGYQRLRELAFQLRSRSQPRYRQGKAKLYRWSENDFKELSAVFNGPHPETGEELEVAEELHPEGALAYDLPPQPAVFAPGPEAGEIEEIAQKLREAAGLPKEPSGEVANQGKRR